MPTYATQLTPFGTAKVKLNISQQLKGEKGEPGIGIFDITYDFLSDYIAVRNGEPVPLQAPPDTQAQIANYSQYMQWQQEQRRQRHYLQNLQTQLRHVQWRLYKLLNPKPAEPIEIDDSPDPDFENLADGADEPEDTENVPQDIPPPLDDELESTDDGENEIDEPFDLP